VATHTYYHTTPNSRIVVMVAASQSKDYYFRGGELTLNDEDEEDLCAIDYLSKIADKPASPVSSLKNPAALEAEEAANMIKDNARKVIEALSKAR
jgi:hypothetical protein